MANLPLKLNAYVSRNRAEITLLESMTYELGVPQIFPTHGGTTA